MSSIFEKIASGALPGHVIFRGTRTFIFISLDGHPLVAPIKCAESLADLDEETGRELFALAQRAAAAIRVATGCDGVNLVLSDGRAAGQDVFHVHMHVKPRWYGDDTVLSWDTQTRPEKERAHLARLLSSHLGLEMN